jgi:hypothetical protein
MVKVASVGAAQGLHGPAYLRTGPPDHVFILDTGDHKVKEISSSGKIVAELNLPQGFSAKGSIRLSDMAFSRDGTLWLCDVNLYTVGLLPDGSIHSLGAEGRAFRLATLQDRLIIMQPPTSNELFASYTLSGHLIAKFGQFLEDQSRNGLPLLGRISAGDESESIFYVPSYGGFLACVTAEGITRFVVRTIEPPELPELILTRSGAVTYHGRLPVSVLGICVAAQRVYLLTALSTKLGTTARLVDVYSATNGSYLYSTAIQDRWTGMLFAGDLLYTSTDEGVTIWHRPADSPAVSDPNARTNGRP